MIIVTYVFAIMAILFLSFDVLFQYAFIPALIGLFFGLFAKRKKYKNTTLPIIACIILIIFSLLSQIILISINLLV